MGYASELIRDARENTASESDAALAALVKVSAPTLNQWKNEGVPLAEKRVLQLAKLAGRDPAVALIEYRLATEKDPLVLEHMGRLMEMVRSAQPGAVYRKAGKTVIPGSRRRRRNETPSAGVTA